MMVTDLKDNGIYVEVHGSVIADVIILRLNPIILYWSLAEMIGNMALLSIYMSLSKHIAFIKKSAIVQIFFMNSSCTTVKVTPQRCTPLFPSQYSSLKSSLCEKLLR